jgi:hypothetical protein
MESNVSIEQIELLKKAMSTHPQLVKDSLELFNIVEPQNLTVKQFTVIMERVRKMKLWGSSMKIVLVCLLTSPLCLASDKSDRLPDANHDNVTNNINITNQLSPAPSPRRHRISHPSPKHPKVIAAHEEVKRRQEEDDFITCCCFFKMKKLPIH